MPPPRPAVGDDDHPADDGPTALEAAAQAHGARAAAKHDAEIASALGALVDAAHGHPVPRTPGMRMDALLALLAPALQARPGAPVDVPREAMVAALNGVLGDHLARTRHRLAIPMTFRAEGRAVTLDRDALAAAYPRGGSRLLVLVHDLCGSGLPGPDDPGTALADALGFTPVHLHYASGLHVSTNGRTSALQLERLLHDWPHPIVRFAIVAFGMGGLLARSALHHGRAAGQYWVHRLDDLACIGTPHHGAPLERAGGLHPLLAGTPQAAIFERLARWRAPGMTDFAHGNLLDDDWAGGNRLARATDRRVPVPLPAGPRCYAIAGSVTEPGAVPGDGLVPVASALGRHRLVRRTLAFPAPHQRTFVDLDHAGLSSSAAVAEQLIAWFSH
jgi:hypothetical protein